MALTYDFHPDAESEHLDTINWYHSEASLAISEKYAQKILEMIQLILENPLAFSREFPHLRRCIVSGLPHKIIYSVESDRIFILAIAHFRRKSSYWSDRLE